MNELYFLRHGESQDIADGLQSRADSPLSKLGRQQAIQAGERLQESGIQPDLIICSPFPRATQTAQLAARGLRYPLGRIKGEPRLSEINRGVIMGMTFTDARRVVEQYGGHDHVPEAETIKQLQARVADYWRELQRRREPTILLVGHDNWGRALRRVILGIPPEREDQRNPVRIPLADPVKLWPK